MTPRASQSNVVVVLAGLLGAAGVALAAAAAHKVDEPALATASNFMILHAAAAVAVAAKAAISRRPLVWINAAAILLAGTVLFSGDIAIRSFSGHRLFPMAAPIGGSTMIAGWFTIAVAAILELRATAK